MAPTKNLTFSIYRIDVQSKLRYRAKALLPQLSAIGVRHGVQLQIFDIYFIEGQVTPKKIRELAQTLICDPVTDHYALRKVENDRVNSFNGQSETHSVEVALRPGVTDNVANELLNAASRLGMAEVQAVATGTRYAFTGDLSEADLHHIARSLLVNDTIQRYTLGEITPEFIHPSPEVHPPEQIALAGLDEAGLLALSAERRLALDANEMRAVRAYFDEIARAPTDAELETIAQTWSEHCVHKTFKAKIEIRDWRTESGQE